MNVAQRPGWAAPHLALSVLTVAIAATSPFGVLRTVQAGLSQLPAALQRQPEPLAEPLADPAPLKPQLSTAPANPPAPPFVLRVRSWAEKRQAVRCLAQAIYFEAGFQPIEGQRAVAQVVLNRVREKGYPKSVCGVIYEGWRRHTGCQFTFVCDGSLHRRPPTADELRKAEQLARQALDGYVVPAVGTATNYHSDRVDPYWRTDLVKTAQIGDHIFYRSHGKAGEPQALDADRYAGNEIKVAESAPRIAMMG